MTLLRTLVFSFAVLWCLSQCEHAGADHYTERVKPLLAEKCIACHGPLRSESGLRLDAAKFIRKGSDERAIVVASHPSESILLQKVSTSMLDEQMPPEGEGVRLTSAELAVLEKWIADGLPSPEDETYIASPREHWAYQPIVRPTIPEPSIIEQDDAGAIDRLLGDLQRQRGVNRIAHADRETWLRRVSLDLNGLPPTTEEVVAFVADNAPDAKERVVDRLLARPAHGERWGRHWMDVWRYSDWDGYKEELRGSQRHIWHWRDWIIESVNADKPYDQMIVEMLAGDEIAPTDIKTVRATGFLARNYHRSNRNIWLDATVEHTAKAFLGMTLACARCHDHKFDPLSQEEYYRFRAIFEPHEVRTHQVAGEPDVTKAGIPRAFDAKPAAETFLFVRGNEKQPQKDRPITPGIPAALEIPYEMHPVAIPQSVYQPALDPVAETNAIETAWRKLEAARKLTEFKLAALREAARAAAAEGKPQEVVAPTKDSPEQTVDDDELDPIALASLDEQVAESELIALRARYAADHAKINQLATEPLQNLIRKAALAEQQFNLLASRASVQSAITKLAAAQADVRLKAVKKSAAITQAEKDLQKQREALVKAREKVGSEPTSYTPVGEIYPQESTGRRLGLARWIVDGRNPLTARVAANHIWSRHFGTALVDDVADFGLRAKQPVTHALLDWLADELRQSGWDMKQVHRRIVLSNTFGLSSSTGIEHSHDTQLAVDPENRLYWRAPVRRLDAEEIRDSLLAVSDNLDRTLSGPDLSEDDGEKVLRRSVYFRHAYEKQVAMLVLFDGASPNECYRRSPSILPQQALALANSSLSRDLSRRLGERLHKKVAETSAGDSAGIQPEEFVNQLFMAVLCRKPIAAESETCTKFLSDSSSGETLLARCQSLTHALINHNDFVVAR